MMLEQIKTWALEAMINFLLSTHRTRAVVTPMPTRQYLLKMPSLPSLDMEAGTMISTNLLSLKLPVIKLQVTTGIVYV